VLRGQRQAARRSTFVFGCLLFDDGGRPGLAAGVTE
jgi:hypothetical protein